ncbi:MAG: hypothetical protein HY689_11480 [Chloroflexi bacterium]|nr:hypothetical protein [Chloroflexota bacterium]
MAGHRAQLSYRRHVPSVPSPWAALLPLGTAVPVVAHAGGTGFLDETLGYGMGLVVVALLVSVLAGWWER